jgi:flagellar basal-body rod protein FlgG
VNRALAAGAAGMAGQQRILDSIAANLANLDTPGFRASRPEFAALVSPDGNAFGAATPQSPHTLFTQGRLEETGNLHDLAIDGEGLFRVVTPSGHTAYTRAGNFTPDARGRLLLPNGAALDGVRLPASTTSFDVESDGIVHAHIAGTATPARGGNIRLSVVPSSSALRLGSDGLFYLTPEAGPVSSGTPGAGGLGMLKQRCLERANVSVVDAMMSILSAQRAYEANAKTVQAADEMLRLANNLERG